MKKLFDRSFMCGILIFLTAPTVMAQDIPEFKITWKTGSSFGLLLTKQTSDKEIEQILYAIRDLAKRDQLSKYFTPTTPGLKNKYSMFQIEIFTDPKWASENMMTRFDNGKLSKRTEREYMDKVRGYYGYSFDNSGNKSEMGNIGYKEGHYQSKNYKLLFKTGYWPGFK